MRTRSLVIGLLLPDLAAAVARAQAPVADASPRRAATATSGQQPPAASRPAEQESPRLYRGRVVSASKVEQQIVNAPGNRLGHHLGCD